MTSFSVQIFLTPDESFSLFSKNTGGKVLQPVVVFYSIFVAAKNLREFISRRILPGTGILSIEDADIMYTLLLEEFNSIEEPHNSDGFMFIRDIQHGLVYKQSFLSRRLAKLAKNPLKGRGDKGPVTAMIEFKKRLASEKHAEGVRGTHHGNAKKIRLTDTGRRAIEMVHSRYSELAKQMLSTVPSEQWRSQVNVNRFIADLIRSA